MSGIINKVKEALHHDSSTTHNTTTGTTGTHGTTGTGVGHTTGTTHTGVGHTTGTTGTGVGHTGHTHGTTGTTGTTGIGSTTGTTGIGITGNKHTHGTAEGVAGPHSSRVANAADPRVDSDLDGSHKTFGATGGGVGHTSHVHQGVSSTTGSGVGATSNLTGVTPTHQQPVHDSALLNKLDPRVKTGTTGTTGTHVGTTGTTGTHVGTTGTTGTHTGTGYSGTHAGNHTGTTHTGTVGGISNSTNAGPHDSNVANKLDPRVDSDLDGRGNRHGATTGGVFGVSGSHATPGSGTAQNTAGPHNSDTLNKLDPRVDSDLDGSGGRKTNY